MRKTNREQTLFGHGFAPVSLHGSSNSASNRRNCHSWCFAFPCFCDTLLMDVAAKISQELLDQGYAGGDCLWQVPPLLVAARPR